MAKPMPPWAQIEIRPWRASRRFISRARVVTRRAPDGTWALEYDYAGKTWIDVGPKGMPNKWVTLRALSALAAAGR